MVHLKNIIFDGPRIRKLMKDENFSGSMNLDELTVWLAFAEVADNFLGNHKAEITKKSFGTCWRNSSTLEWR